MGSRNSLLPGLAWLALAPAIAVAGTDPVTVSPGAPDRVAPIAGRCPTFSWTAPEGAVGQELVVFRAAAADLEIDRAAPVLEAELPGPASAWTPELAGCLDPGGVYAWTVRADFEDGASAWADARLFSVPAVPSPEELEGALDIVKRYLASRSGTVGVAPARPVGAAPSTAAPAESYPFGETFYVAADGTVVGNAFVYSCGVGSLGDYWRDGDGDGYGSPSDPTTACAQPPGHVANDGDCDDGNPTLNESCVCDPLDPAVVCGPATHCEPQTSGDPLCTAPTGGGAQDAVCAANADCQAAFWCSSGDNLCEQWCRVLGSDCPVAHSCASFGAPRYIGATEWGVCVAD